MSATKVKGLSERLKEDGVLVAEGYVFNMERRGYLKAGAYVPEVVLENPELVKDAYREFVHAGSDVVLALTYYAHRDKMSVIEREKDVEALNRLALKMAREVADETSTLMAGNICNTNIYIPGNQENLNSIRAIFKEQVEWAVEANADFMVCETFQSFEEAMLALECVKEYGKGMLAIVTLDIHKNVVDGKVATIDQVPVADACKKLEDAGAAAVGVNCARGPETMLPIIKEIKKVCKGPVAALPVVFRTSKDEPTMQSLTDPLTGERIFPLDLDCALCSCEDIYDFGQKCKELGVQYVGLCCGNYAHFTRTLAESLGRKPPASRYSPDMSQHYALGTDASLKKFNTTTAIKML